ncbi:Cys-tRNA(Pro) deacylase [Aestuariibacter sp. GS-14]|uniref:Cys-tRNA(Pro) deacylase n=1 Tax=Alteromonadaceae TaxID=72275 RepID=UPI001126111E|nr:Cys-tRNA(Pro) deacylase [Aestuariibacter sp. GS-14]TPV55472.1 Cys-tRNA(Pro) deacylase [Aestuariibacter sp. GS-14]
MTPGIVAAERKKIAHKVHKYTHDKQAASYGLEAAEKLSLPPEQVFKTLVAELDTGALVVAVVPVTHQLNLKQLAKVAGAKKAQMGNPQKVERTTGYVLGGVSPLGQKKALPTFIDASAEPFSTIFVSAGKRGLEIELSPQDLASLTRGKFAALAG